MSIYRTILGGAAALLALAAVPAQAQEAEYKTVEAKNLASGKQTIDPAKAYILVTAPTRAQGLFIKSADAAELAEYNAEYDEEFAEALEKYPRKLRNWEADREANRKAGERPAEPKRETFSIGAIEPRMLVPFGPMFVFDKSTEDKASQSFTYLVEVEPGTYTYYGPIYYLPGAPAMGTCFCMGSVGFEAAAGQITNLGDFLTLGWADDAALKASSYLAADTGRLAKPASYPVPAALAAHKVVNAEFRAAGKINNFLAIPVGRMPPVEGVLGYQRDKIIDLRAAAAAEGPADTPATGEAPAS